MNCIILCKTAASYNRYIKKFPNGGTIKVVLYSETAICGFRASNLIVMDEWTDEELDHIILPMLVAPTRPAGPVDFAKIVGS